MWGFAVGVEMDRPMIARFPGYVRGGGRIG